MPLKALKTRKMTESDKNARLVNKIFTAPKEKDFENSTQKLK